MKIKPEKLPFPSEAIHQHLIALGKTGSGKSSKLRLIVENILSHDEEAPVCIIDPKGDWWGLKSSADGKSEGFPIVIFGGEHADVPLNEHSGAHIAELIATGNRPCLIDLGGWMVGERTRFFVDFASTFFRVARGRRYMVIDEVHNFAPQQKVEKNPDAMKMLHWANRLASEGRGKGITLLAASQRPQKVHKDFVTSCETLVACKVIHKLDRDAIKDWIDGCADPVKGREVIADLAQLKKPEAWVWSPEIEFGPEKATFPMFSTYDSFKPQAAGSGKLKGWASVDLEDVKTKLASVVEEVKANDPAELKRKVRSLEQELDKLKRNPAQVKLLPPPIPKRVPILTASNEKAVATLIARLDRSEHAVEKYAEMFHLRHMQTMADIGHAKELCKSVITSSKLVMPVEPKVPAFSTIGPVPHPPVAPIRLTRDLQIHPDQGGDWQPGGPHRKILTVLSQYPNGIHINKLALLSGRSVNGTMRNLLADLRTNGCMDGENTGTMRITPRGESFGPFEQLPEGLALIEFWRNRFGTPERAIFDALHDYPDGLGIQDLAARSNRQVNGTMRNNLATLRTAGVITGPNTGIMKLNPELFQ